MALPICILPARSFRFILGCRVKELSQVVPLEGFKVVADDAHPAYILKRISANASSEVQARRNAALTV